MAEYVRGEELGGNGVISDVSAARGCHVGARWVFLHI